MSLVVRCEDCAVSFRAKQELSGKKVRCPKCKQILVVPSTADSSKKRLPEKSSSKSPKGQVATPKSSSPPREKAASAPKAKPGNAKKPETPARKLTRQEVGQKILGALSGQIEPVATAASYRFGIVFALFIMVLLPLLYIGLIALVAYGVYYHAVNHIQILSSEGGGRKGFLSLLVYLAPMVSGVILIAFMIRPLFIRSQEGGRTRSLKQESEPLLFAFVYRICDMVGAPRPTRIVVNCEVNAMAGLEPGFMSFLRRDLVLTIGLPLVAGFDVRQFGGVLAHEFGHFSQGTGMRVSNLVRRISYWFTRVVYERSSWDRHLANASGGIDLRIGWIFWLARFFIWVTRWILWGLMMLGHFAAGFILREMEFEADLYETRLAGADTFESTARKLQVLGVASQKSFDDLGDYYNEGRLGDDLPRLIVANIRHITPEIQEKIDKSMRESTTGLFDTHPCDAERIEHAYEDNSTGLFRLTYPATVLFNDFEAQSRQTTLEFYREIFGNKLDPKSINSVSHLLERQEQQEVASGATNRYFQGTFVTLRPLQLPLWNITAPQDPKATAKAVSRARQKIVELAPANRKVLKEYMECSGRIIQAEMARAQLEAGFRVGRKDYDTPMTTKEAAMRNRGQAAGSMEKLAKEMEPFEKMAATRVAAALQLLQLAPVAAKIEKADSLRKQCREYLPCLRLVGEQIPYLVTIQYEYAALAHLTHALEGNEDNESLINSIRWRMETLLRNLRELSEVLFRINYPYDHGKGNITIAQYVVPELPTSDDLGGIYGASQTVLERLPDLYGRLAADIVHIAEQVESAIGFEPLPEPPKEKEENEEEGATD